MPELVCAVYRPERTADQFRLYLAVPRLFPICCCRQHPMPLPPIEPGRPDTFLESVLLCRPAVHVAGRCIPSGCRYLMEKLISYPVPLSLSVRLTVNVEFPTTAPASRHPAIAEQIVNGKRLPRAIVLRRCEA